MPPRAKRQGEKDVAANRAVAGEEPRPAAPERPASKPRATGKTDDGFGSVFGDRRGA